MAQFAVNVSGHRMVEYLNFSVLSWDLLRSIGFTSISKISSGLFEANFLKSPYINFFGCRTPKLRLKWNLELKILKNQGSPPL